MLPLYTSAQKYNFYLEWQKDFNNIFEKGEVFNKILDSESRKTNTGFTGKG